MGVNLAEGNERRGGAQAAHVRVVRVRVRVRGWGGVPAEPGERVASKGEGEGEARGGAAWLRSQGGGSSAKHGSRSDKMIRSYSVRFHASRCT